MPEVQPYAHLCHIADTGDEMVAAIERALGEGNRQARLDRSALMQNETWEARVAAIEHVIEQLEAREAQTAQDDLIGAWPVREQAIAG
jgi:hypothetical protein